MELNKKSTVGRLKIADEVILSVARQVVGDISGVYSLAEPAASLTGFLLPKRVTAPIRLSFNGDVAVIEISVLLKYGCRIREVAEEIQRSVKSAVQDMCGLTVSKVHVNISGIVFPDGK